MDGESSVEVEAGIGFEEADSSVLVSLLGGRPRGGYADENAEPRVFRQRTSPWGFRGGTQVEEGGGARSFES